MPMKFKQIQAFITVAREGNMTLAAEKMGITQSGLSRLLLLSLIHISEPTRPY